MENEEKRSVMVQNRVFPSLRPAIYQEASRDQPLESESPQCFNAFLIASDLIVVSPLRSANEQPATAAVSSASELPAAAAGTEPAAPVNL